MNLSLFKVFKGDNGDNTLSYANKVDGRFTAVLGYGGSDYLSGYAMHGGTGNDTYYVDSLEDIVVEKAGEGIDKVISNVRYYVLPDYVENLDLFGLTLNGMTAGAENGFGNNLGNTINGNSRANYISGGGGNDFLFGFAGDDQVSGGTGNDHVNGGAGQDKLIGSNQSAAGANEIDVLTGGAGADKFFLGEPGYVLYANNAKNDYALITDFEIGVDIICLGAKTTNGAYNLTNDLPTGVSGVGITYSSINSSGTLVTDLIAVIQGNNVSDQTINLTDSSQFSFSQFF